MNDHVKHSIDALAGLAAFGAAAAHWAKLAADIANPVLIAISTMMSICWLGVRFYEWARTGRAED